MPNTTVTVQKHEAPFTAKEITYLAATADTADLAEVFEFAAARPSRHYRIRVKSGGSAASGDIAVKCNAGDFWAAQGKSLVCPETKEIEFMVETGYLKKSTGKIEITLTPASGKKLKTDEAASIAVIEDCYT